MDDDKHLIHQTPSFQQQFFSSWESLKERLRSSFVESDSREQVTESNSNTQDASINRVIYALESLLNEEITCSQLLTKQNLSITQIDHCQQVELWDCGIACLLMISRWLSPIEDILEYSSEMLPAEQQLREELLANIDAKSIWTADLVLELHKLLENHQANYIFCSKNLGVDESYKNFGYYCDNFARDQGRVKDAFAKLEKCSSSCFATSYLPLELVMNAVCRPHCIAIALVDNTKLHESSMSDNHDDDGIGYVGHYVIVCGCSNDPDHLAQARQQLDAEDDKEDDRCLVLMNPAQAGSPTMYVLPSRFERSWRASGTDDDIVFVVRH